MSACLLVSLSHLSLSLFNLHPCLNVWQLPIWMNKSSDARLDRSEVSRLSVVIIFTHGWFTSHFQESEPINIKDGQCALSYAPPFTVQLPQSPWQTVSAATVKIQLNLNLKYLNHITLAVIVKLKTHLLDFAFIRCFLNYFPLVSVVFHKLQNCNCLSTSQSCFSKWNMLTLIKKLQGMQGREEKPIWSRNCEQSSFVSVSFHDLWLHKAYDLSTGLKTLWLTEQLVWYKCKE